jgi:zinc transporter, ZIP family
MRRLVFGILPLALLGVLVLLFLSRGVPSVFRSSVPPIEKISFERVVFHPDEIILTVINDGPSPIIISQVQVNSAFWDFEMDPEGPLGRLERARIRILYPWNEGEPQRVTILTRSGIVFEKEIEAAVETPRIERRYVGSLALLGTYVGVIPVFIGIMWFPFLRKLKKGWFGFLLSLTLGLLFFLGVDSVIEGIRTAAKAPGSLNGFGVLTLGFATAFFALFAIGGKKRKEGTSREDSPRAMALALSISLGIGVHNLGEGLSVGGAYAIGEIALGTLLVVGFMVHNATEGIAIAAPISKIRVSLPSLIVLGALAGAPTILGAWIGGFAYSPLWAALFFGIGAGAIFQVLIEIARQLSQGSSRAFFTLKNTAGFIAGLFVMYATGLLVAA